MSAHLWQDLSGGEFLLFLVALPQLETVGVFKKKMIVVTIF